MAVFEQYGSVMKEKYSNIELLVSNTFLKQDEVPGFKVGLKVVNNDSKSLHFDVSETELYVNNQRNVAWDLAVQNGTIINLRIAPNSSQEIWWPLGEALFMKGGNYKLELRWKDFTQKEEVEVR